ncbi:unnamed protein product, partial [Prorocentrum cordatum]
AHLDGGPALSQSTAQPSFPCACWTEALPVPGASSGAVLTLALLDDDPLQPRAGRFSFGRVELQLTGEFMGRHDHVPLQDSPGSTGYLTFELSRAPMRVEGRRRQGPTHLRPTLPSWLQGTDADFCGVLRVAADRRSRRGVFQVSVGRCNFTSWEAGFEARSGECGKRLLVVESKPLMSVHATLQAEEGRTLDAHGELHLAKVEGPSGTQSLLMEDRPNPLTLQWKTAEHGRERPHLHYRFFSAEFLQPSDPSGVCVTVTLQMASATVSLPLAVHVPRECFQRGAGAGTEAFALGRTGARAEIYLPDAQRLVDWSAWEVTPAVPTAFPACPGPGSAGGGWLVDVLALRLRLGTERTVALPLGPDLVVLRFCASRLSLLPRPVLGDGGAQEASAAPAQDPRSGEVAGIVVHSLAVHSPAVCQCLLSGGAGPSVLFAELPHQASRCFVPAEPDGRGRVCIHALLPEWGLSASAEAQLGDGALELHWVFATQQGDVHAAGRATCAQWPVPVGGHPTVPVTAHVLRLRIPEELVPQLAPVEVRLGRGPGRSFVWAGSEDGGDEEILPYSAFEEDPCAVSVRCGKQARAQMQFSLLDLLAAQLLTGGRGLLSLPVLVEADVQRDGTRFAAFLFLPVRLQCSATAVAHGPTGPVASAGGLLLLQGVAVSASLDATAHRAGCPALENPERHAWQPAPRVSMRAGAQHSSGLALPRTLCCAAASWGPDGRAQRCIDLTPHVLAVLLPGAPGEADLRVDLQLQCPHCGANVELQASPKDSLELAQLPAWRSFTVRMQVHSRGPQVLRGGALAFARMAVCPSRLARSPQGLLSLSLETPRGEDEAGLPELLDWCGRLGGHGAQGRSEGDAALSVRLSVTGPTPASLSLDGMSVIAAPAQLVVETGAEHALAYLTLEAQRLSGLRVLLARVPLAALGPLEDGRPVRYPLLFTPNLRPVLVATYEPRRGFPTSDAAEAAPAPAAEPGGPAEAVPSPRARLAAEIRSVMRLSPPEVQ